MSRLLKTMSLLASLLAGSAGAALPVALDLAPQVTTRATTAWPAMPPQPLPKGLRPCCAFGYNLHAELLGMPVPFYQLDNVVPASDLGLHQYNDSMLAGLENLTGLSRENNGILYTTHGGFIDTAHVRDTADMTVYIFSQILPKLGQAFTLDLDSELAQRRLVFNAFTPPTDPVARYTLAAWLAAHLAFQVAEWHEIAQWYGFESVPGFSEGVSAFSPEDLYSNLLGARLAVSLILEGQTVSQGVYEVAMGTALRQALVHLGAQSPELTRFHFDMLDGRWWNSRRRVPEKYLVLRRNYQMGDNFIRPLLIRMGADLPMILILSGVIGGLVAFGMIGLFIGPVLLAVSWRLYDAWVNEAPPPPKDPDLVLEELSELNTRTTQDK